MRTMQPTKLSLDPRTVDLAREMAGKYGACASLSAVTRRAIALLAERFAGISSAEELNAERGRLLPHLSRAERGRCDRDRAA